MKTILLVLFLIILFITIICMSAAIRISGKCSQDEEEHSVLDSRKYGKDKKENKSNGN